MNMHVFQTPKEKKHWDVQRTWIAPWRLADDYHVYGLEWGKDEIRYFVDGVVVRTVEHALHQPALSDHEQRNNARVVRDAPRQGSALDVQHRIRAGVETPTVKGDCYCEEDGSMCHVIGLDGSVCLG